MSIKSYKDLIVWRKAYNLCLDVYKITNNYPDNERFGLVSQTRRSAVSVVSNIAEGCSRYGYKNEYRHFIVVAYASSSELETQLLLARDLDFNVEDGYSDIFNRLEEVQKMLGGLISKLKTSH